MTNTLSKEINYESLDELYELGEARNEFSLSKKQLERINISYEMLLKACSGKDQKVYGFHTYYGDNVRNEIDSTKWRDTQLGLLEYLQVGMGESLPDSVVRRALKLQLIKTSHGYSGIHPETVNKLVKFANSSHLTSVPRKGSLGASGDLVSMAHAVAPIFEEGVNGPRDVIGLLNTNSMMSSWAIEQYQKVKELLEACIETVGMLSFSIGTTDEHFSLNRVNGAALSPSYIKAGQKIIGARESLKLKGFQEREKSLHQSRYSFRCAPQIIGHCLDVLDFTEKKILSEATALADNPIVLDDGNIWHGGLFYAIGIASAADGLAEIIHRLSEMLDRQILILMDKNLNSGLPDNLKFHGMSHCKGLHQAISALHQEVKASSAPSRSMSFSCEGNNQDLVPCGMTALNQVDRLRETFSEIVRASMFCAVRGVHLSRGEKLPIDLHIKNFSNSTISNIRDLI